MANLNKGTKLNPSIYKTIIPDQLKQGAQKDNIGPSIETKFLQASKFNNKIELEKNKSSLDFIRDMIIAGLANQGG